MLLAEKMEVNDRARSDWNDEITDFLAELRELKKSWVMKVEEADSANKKLFATCIVVVIP